MKSLLTWSNACTTALIMLALVIMVSPQAKALVIRGMMEVGLMKPPAQNAATTATAGNTAPVAPAIMLRSVKGELINTAGQNGKVLIINFWATWCPPCIAEMPSINEMYQHYKNNPNVLVLPVDVDNNFQKSIPFMQRNHYALPVYNINGDLPQEFVSGAVPTTVIINKKGVIAARHEGAANYTDKRFYAYIDKLASEK